MTIHRTTIKVRFGELDPYNHVNHAVYLAYLEAGRTEAMEAVGMSIHELSVAGWNMVVTDVWVKFRAPALAGDTVIIETGIAEMGRVSGTWKQRILRGDEVLIEADIRAGSVGGDGRPKRMSTEMADAFRQLFIDGNGVMSRVSR
jgi:acyl-CoA thioester hydrolase